jgi:hypothetical protein
MRAWCDRGISRVVRGSGLTGAATSSLRTGAGDRIASTRGFRAGCSADGTGSEIDGSAGFFVKSASAAWRALVIRSRSSSRGGCCCRWLSKGCPDYLAAREIEEEFVQFGKSLLHVPCAVSTSRVAKQGILENRSWTAAPPLAALLCVSRQPFLSGSFFRHSLFEPVS